MDLLDNVFNLLRKATTAIGTAIAPSTASAPNDIKVLGPGTWGGVSVTITPFVNKSDPAGVVNTSSTAGIPGGVSGEFTSQLGHGPSKIITITFSSNISQVAITIRNPNVAGNRMVAYDVNGKVLGAVDFNYQANSNHYNNDFFDRRALAFSGIRRIDLVPGIGDYVSYRDLVITAQLPSVVTPPKPPSAPSDSVVSIPLQVRAIQRPKSVAVSIPITVDVKPRIPKFDREPFATEVQLQVNPILIPLERLIEQLAQELTQPKIASFFDNSRVLKTLLNFGNDFQVLLTNWMRDQNALAGDSVLVKLYRPLPLNVDVKDVLWISRELSPTLLDQISVVITPEQKVTLFLRPPNRAINLGSLSGIEVENATLAKLLPSGSISVSQTSATLKDPLLEQFFTTGLEGVELNVDYTDYNNFVHYSSAAARLNVFRQKLIQIEDLNAAIAGQMQAASASVANGVVTNISGTANWSYITTLLQQKQDIIRSFDGYERFLYFDTGSFSGTLSGLPEDDIIFIPNVSWPKVSGSVLSVTSSEAMAFFASQSQLAVEFDKQNTEALVNNIPQFLQDDNNSVEFLTFLNMIGHHFDLVKLYIDNLTKIYDRDPSPSRGLSRELLWHIAQSLGIELPNQYAIKNLVDFVIGPASATQQTYSEAIAETWKRFLHNQIYIAKSKGTKAALQALINAYGIPPELIRVREAVTPGALEESGSFETYDELDYVLSFTTGAHLDVPFASTGYNPSAIQLRFATTTVSSSILIDGVSGSALWSLILVPTGSSTKGTIQLKNSLGSVIAKTQVGDFYSGDYFTVMLRRQSPTVFDLVTKRFDQDLWEYADRQIITDANFTGSWSTVQTVKLGGGSGSFNGTIDEFRIWTESPSDETFDLFVKYPGMMAGNTSGSARDSLLWRHSMLKPRNLGVTSSLPNDSPFVLFHTGSGEISASVAVGFPSVTVFPYNFVPIRRTVSRFTFDAGGYQFATDTIRVMPPPTFDSASLVITGSNVIPVLHRDKSIRSFVDKRDDRQTTNKIGFYLTLAETINDSILRSLGNISLTDLIGDPRDLFSSTYPDLQKLNKFYHDNYANEVDYNTFIQFVEGLSDGLFAQARKLIPARAKLLTGIVIEPTILERARAPLNRPLQVDGYRTRRERNARTLLMQSGSYPDARYAEADIGQVTPIPSADFNTMDTTIFMPVVDLMSADTTQLEGILAQITQSVMASDETFDATIVQSDTLNVLADDLSHDAVVDVKNIQQLMSETIPLNALFVTTGSFAISATVPAYDADVDVHDLIFTRIFANLPFVSPVVQPVSDLSSPAGSVYFTHPSGSFGITKIVQVPVRTGSLNDRGIWVAGSTYFKNDMVTQVSQSGAAAAGNGKQYRCFVDGVLDANGNRVNFVSTVPPSLDRIHWVEVSTIPVVTLDVRFAVHANVSGSPDPAGVTVTIVPNLGNNVPFIGYAPTHYKFFRDQSLRYRLPRFLGCKNTQTTTFDGQPPIETKLSSDAQLFVTKGRPIPPSTDEGGPILEVR